MDRLHAETNHAAVRKTSLPAITLLMALVVLALGACSKTNGGSGTGTVSFSLKMPEAQYKVPAGFCEEYGIANVVAEVRDAGNNLVATGGPWNCNAGEGVVSGVEEGSNYSILVSLRDSSGVTVFHGSRGGIDVVAGRTTDAGEIELAGTNIAPVFADVANQQVAETATLTFTISATDPDGNNLTYSAVSIPTGAEFNASTGQFSWTPSYAQGGTHTATFQVTDDGVPPLSDTLSVTITVGDVNQPPVLTVPAGIQQVTTTGTLEFTVSATDPDGDTLTYDLAYAPFSPTSYVYLPGWTFDPDTRTFSWAVSGTYPYDPVGEHKVLFRVTDDGTPRMSDYEWVTIQVYDTVTQLNNRRLPVITPIGPQQIDPGQTLQFTVNASDPDGNPLTYTASTIATKNPPTNYVFGSDHIFNWITTTQGNYWIRFRAQDTLDYYGSTYVDYAQEDVVITVGDVNRPPVLDPIGRRLAQNGDTLEFVVTATDPDNDSLTYSMSFPGATSAPPAAATFDPVTQKFSWQLVDEPMGSYTIRFTVTDSGSPSESDYEDVPIRVQ